MSMALKYKMMKKAKGGEVKESPGSEQDMINKYGKGSKQHQQYNLVLGEHDAVDRYGNGSKEHKKHQEHMRKSGIPVIGKLAEGGEVDMQDTPEQQELIGGMKKAFKKPMAEGGKCYACGGFVHDEEASGYEDMPEDSDDMIGEIMRKGKKSGMDYYSEGGRVANDTPPVADSEDNEFDDLVKDDHLDEHYTGKNSGDEDGDDEEDEDRRDVVSMIMKSRKKKDKMPRPA